MKLFILFIAFSSFILSTEINSIESQQFEPKLSSFISESADYLKHNYNKNSENHQLASLDVIGYGYKSIKAENFKVLILFSTFSKLAISALTENKKKTNFFLEDIKSYGIKKDDVYFNSFDITAKYAVKMNFDDLEEVDGYFVSQEIIVSLKSKTLTANVVDSAQKRNGLLKSVNLVVPEKIVEDIKKELIKLAVYDSWTKAIKTANQLGYKITSVKSMKLNDNKMKNNDNLEYVQTLQTEETFYLSVEVTFSIEKDYK